MWIQKEGDRIFGNDHRREGSKDGYNKSGSNYVMADAEVHEGHPSIFGTSQLLLPLYSGFLKNCYTIK